MKILRIALSLMAFFGISPACPAEEMISIADAHSPFPAAAAEPLQLHASDAKLDAGFSLGGAIGLARLGSLQRHDLALATVHIGRRVGNVVGNGEWYRGHWSLRAEVFGGAQFSPRIAYFASVTPVLRYTFDTGTRWVPFFDAGSGIMVTDIKRPDLSTVFQFVSQAGPGLHYFVRNDTALSIQCRLAHISNAGIRQPNGGVNVVAFSGGLSWFF